MSPKIIFYIRCLFHEDRVRGCEKVNNDTYFPFFSKLYGMSIFEYRKRVHDIQLENLKSISTKIIENKYFANNYHQYNSPFTIVQQPSLEQFCELDDDAILIPLDDDDWINPDIIEYAFDYDALNVWSTISLTPNSPFFYFKHTPCKKLSFDVDAKIKTNDTILRGLLSNCYGVPTRVIKQLARQKNSHVLTRLLQHHVQVRHVIRDQPRFIHKENIRDEIFSVYVRHLANITLLSSWQQESNNNLKNLKERILNDTRNYFYFHKEYINDIPPEFDWVKPYQSKLTDLNISCLTNFL